ncbi:uncharacterized protein LOC135818784 [Sycon ciliatum]|uniref:uncharacterized protein LOC135818784 n=1 Tax=Sycon ciliatum TaxID=27933 RepID=UPI0031F6ED7A
MSPFSQMYVAIYLLCGLSSMLVSVKARGQHGSCVATYLHQAGITRARAARYEAGFAQRDIPAEHIAAIPPSILSSFGVNRTGDALKLSNCFSGRIQSCASFEHCHANGQCLLQPRRNGNPRVYGCACKAGFKGTECESDACAVGGSTPICHNGGTCVRLSTAPYYRCQCRENYIGGQCQAARNHCRPQNPCAHGGKCRSLLAKYICDCARGYVGKTCQDHLFTSRELDERFAKQQELILSRFAEQTSAILSQFARQKEVINSRFSKHENAILTRLQSLQSRVLTEHGQRRFPAGIWLLSDHVSWFAARAKCIVLGGVLAVPKSSREHSEVRRLAQQQRYNGHIWIGASDLLYEGRWRNQAGNALTYSRWGHDEPNNHGGVEDCAAMRGDGQPWVDMECGHRRPFICRFP